MTQTEARPDSGPPEKSVTAERPGQPSRIGTFASLSIPAFRWLLLGTTMSNAAMWIQQVTLGWLVYDMTGSGTVLGSVNLVRSVATLGLAPVAGIVIDRFSRRTLMSWTNTWLLMISGTLGLALVTGQPQLWWLFVFTFCGGAAQAIDLPLRQTIVFTLVPRQLAPNAVALVQTGWSLMRSIGPAIGGVLISIMGPGGNFLVQATAYALITFTIMRLPLPKGAAGGATASRRGSLLDGIKYVAKEPKTRAFVLMGWVLPLFIIPNYVALPPIFAKDVFNGGPEVLGLLLSAVGLGGIAGGIFTASLGNLERRGLVQLASLLLLGFSLIGFAMTTELWLALPLLALSGLFEMVYLTTNQTLLQLSIPDEIRGRVMGIVTLNAGLSPVGAVIAGFGADLMGPRNVTLLLNGIVIAIAVLVYLFSSTVRDYRLSGAIPKGMGGH